MNNKQTDILNVFLIILSLALAFLIPFELFIFSYVVLGPLHYLTEINWLNGKSFFVAQKKWIWVFLILCIIISLPAMLRFPIFSEWKDQVAIKQVTTFISKSFPVIILGMLFFAVGLIYLKKQSHIIIALLTSMLSAFLIIHFVPYSFIIAGIFLPTIVHVYLFTLLFMLSGTLVNKSKPGMLAVVLLMICPIVIILFPLPALEYAVPGSSESAYIINRFATLNNHLAKLLKPFGLDSYQQLSATGIRIQVFIAFCYTYHYLNWFSKTSIIGWNKSLTKPGTFIILTLWIGSLLLYWYNTRIGYTALFFLSITHVFLEFPLNITSIRGIAGKLKNS
jgi:hypothetical protein